MKMSSLFLMSIASMLTIGNSGAMAQAPERISDFKCPFSSYLYFDVPVSNSQYRYIAMQNPAAGVVETLANPNVDGNLVNAMGFDVATGLIWGSIVDGPNKNDLARIGRTEAGQIVLDVSPVVKGEGATLTAVAGDVFNPNGPDSTEPGILVQVETTGGGGDITYLKLPSADDFSQQSATIATKTGSFSVGGDIAFHPDADTVSLLFYSVSDEGQLWRGRLDPEIGQVFGKVIGFILYDPTTLPDDVQDQDVGIPDGEYQSQWFDASGFLYFTDVKTGITYRLTFDDLFNPLLNSAVEWSNSYAVQTADGARCPFNETINLPYTRSPSLIGGSNQMPIMGPSDYPPPNFFNDFGDAPESYRSSLSVSGPRHAYLPGPAQLWLGNVTPDEEQDTAGPAVPFTRLPADEATNSQDERSFDGVFFPTFTLGEPGTVTLVINSFDAVPTDSYLSLFIDWDLNGSFANDPNETILVNHKISAPSTISFDVVPPPNAWPGQTWARIRLSPAEIPFVHPWMGATVGGEVEDHPIMVSTELGEKVEAIQALKVAIKNTISRLIGKESTFANILPAYEQIVNRIVTVKSRLEQQFSLWKRDFDQKLQQFAMATSVTIDTVEQQLSSLKADLLTILGETNAEKEVQYTMLVNYKEFLDTLLSPTVIVENTSQESGDLKGLKNSLMSLLTHDMKGTTEFFDSYETQLAEAYQYIDGLIEGRTSLRP